MTDIDGLRCFEVTFARVGVGPAAGLAEPDDGKLPAALAGGDVEDVLVLAHGWNSSLASARASRRALLALLAEQLGDRRRSSVAVEVNWPSLLFPEDDPGNASPTLSTGAQLASTLTPAFPGQQFELDELGSLLDQQPRSIADLERFHALAKSLVTSPSLAQEDSGEAGMLSIGTIGLFGHAAAMAKALKTGGGNGTDAFGTLWSGAREVLRTLCYYEMKNRAGVVGRDGLAALISQLPTPAGRPLRIHLIGHSFGARLVAYALAGLPRPAGNARGPVKSLYLIQGALSHFAFSGPALAGQGRRTGALAAFAGQLDGPLLATFSRHDRCLGWWYPMASLPRHEGSRSVGELAYRWGAMGHDGFQGAGVHTLPLGPVGQPYPFQAGALYRLDASSVIAANQSAFSGAHSDIRHPELTWPIAQLVHRLSGPDRSR